MADYAITGRKGSGKSLFAVGLMRDALRAGRRVATNLDVRLDVLLGARSRATLTRLPDKPCVDDLDALGRGQEGPVEEENGLLVLDETSTFFNSRSFGDRSRQPMLDWLVHSRKLGWDVYYICQGLDQIDKQLRTTMIEYHISVKRTDKWPIPFVSSLTALLGYRVGFPRLHIGVTRYGVERDGLVCGRKYFRAEDLYPAYDTQQLFLPREHPAACGLHTVLSGYLVRGRYLPEPPGYWRRFVLSLLGKSWEAEVRPQAVELKRKLPVVERLGRLPPDEAVRVWHGLQRRGLI